jgi:hypothetical protein
LHPRRHCSTSSVRRHSYSSDSACCVLTAPDSHGPLKSVLAAVRILGSPPQPAGVGFPFRLISPVAKESTNSTIDPSAPALSQPIASTTSIDHSSPFVASQKPLRTTTLVVGDNRQLVQQQLSKVSAGQHPWTLYPLTASQSTTSPPINYHHNHRPQWRTRYRLIKCRRAFSKLAGKQRI